MNFPLRQTLCPPYSLPHFGIMKDVFEAEEIDRIKFFEKILDFAPAMTTGEQQNNEVHGDYRVAKIATMPIDQNTQWLWEKVAHVTAKANYDLFLYNVEFIESIDYIIYDGSNEGRYGAHRDVLTYGYRKYDRKISGIIMLSDPDEYEGGDLLIDLMGDANKDNWYNAKLEKGDVIFFDSMFTHCVEKITKGNRHVLVFWISGVNKL